MPSLPPTYRTSRQRTPAQARKEDDRRRGSARERGYDARWDQAAIRYRHHNPLCIGCQAVGGVQATTLVDHIVPHRGDDRLFWDEANWQPCCGPHHDIVKQKLELLFSQGQANESDLRLDSAKAVALTRELIR